MVGASGISANPEKIKAINCMRPPTSPRDVQSLMGRMAALSRFISRLKGRSLPFFKALRKHDRFKWTQEAQEVFDDLKRYLSSAPLLTTPKPGEVLLLYLTTSPQAVSIVLVAERNKDQQPIYYVSKILHGPKEHYTEVEKLLYALFMTSRKLRHYFQAHS